jgi:hypothetical protein
MNMEEKIPASGGVKMKDIFWHCVGMLAIFIFFLLIGCERKDEVREFHERQSRSQKETHYLIEIIDSGFIAGVTEGKGKFYIVEFTDWNDTTGGTYSSMVIDSSILASTNMDSLINSRKKEWQ